VLFTQSPTAGSHALPRARALRGDDQSGLTLAASRSADATYLGTSSFAAGGSDGSDGRTCCFDFYRSTQCICISLTVSVRASAVPVRPNSITLSSSRAGSRAGL